MLIKTRKKSQATENQVTDESVYMNRRAVLKKLGFVGAGALLSGVSKANPLDWFKADEKPVFSRRELDFLADETASRAGLTAEDKATTYNNFFEFGTNKDDPYKRAQALRVDPWTLRIEGLVERPFTLDYEQLFSQFTLQERIYRLRCVEAWSMVIPWIGFSLADIIKRAKPLSSAKYIAFETLYDPKQMPGQSNRFIGGGIDYPYVEGLRIDEATHPLSLIAVGMYGKTIPPQNGAPVRLVVPWKYGFKSIKSIVSIKFTDKQPPTTWNMLAANEYGFYANVNPKVDHPRWSQARERRITKGGLFNQERIATLPFNGYDEVAHLYKGMDLRRYY